MSVKGILVNSRGFTGPEAARMLRRMKLQMKEGEERTVKRAGKPVTFKKTKSGRLKIVRD